MKPRMMLAVAFALLCALPTTVRSTPRNDFLTPQEIAKIQDAQEIEERVKIYLEAAALRLKTVSERQQGKESVAGDPLEFFTVDEMLDGYYKILHSVMLNLEDAAPNPKTDQKKFQAAMKNLKTLTELGLKELEMIQKTAEQQQKESTWKLAGKALEISKGAHEGAVNSLPKKTDK